MDLRQQRRTASYNHEFPCTGRKPFYFRECYMGSEKKSYTVDFLTKKTKINEGEVPQYYVENNHPAIIEPELFDLVQTEIQ